MTPAKGHDVGYIRVSSFSQNTDRQLDGIELEKIFTEKASAKDAKRPVLKECMSYLRAGDCLHIHSIDRLARNLMDLQTIVTSLNDKAVSVSFHKENLTFTGSNDNPMNKLMLQMMGAFAEFERALIKERQREGIAKAKQMGKQIGRKRVLTDEQVQDIENRVANGEPKTLLAEEYKISRQTLYTELAKKNMNHLIFVYGTLKHGLHNHYLLEHSEFVGTGWTVDKYALYQDGIHYVVKDEPVSCIQGEVYSVDDETLEALDRLENHPLWYCREQVAVSMGSTSEELIAWLYFNQTPEGRLVHSGCYES